MQSKRSILSLFLILSITAVSAWGAEEPVVDEEEGSTSLQTSNIEGWVEDESETITFFGMGYESRNLGVAPQGGTLGGGRAGPASGGSGGRRNK